MEKPHRENEEIFIRDQEINANCLVNYLEEDR